MMHFRPHHLLCTQFFEGKGYSPAFTEHMTYILEHITEETKIEITNVCDELCEYCPFNQDGKCHSQEKVRKYDEEVMQMIDIHAGDVISFVEAQDKVFHKIIRPGKLKDVCGDCSWYYICGAKRN